VKPGWAADWPALTGEVARFSSDETPDYNCFAHALGEDGAWWEPFVIPPTQPGLYWPPGATPDNTPDAWTEALATRGFEPCGLDATLDPRYVKVAVYANAAGTALHVARHLRDGRWASKLGVFEDIEHDTLAALEGPLYGRVERVVRRPRQPADP